MRRRRPRCPECDRPTAWRELLRLRRLRRERLRHPVTEPPPRYQYGPITITGGDAGAFQRALADEMARFQADLHADFQRRLDGSLWGDGTTEPKEPTGLDALYESQEWGFGETEPDRDHDTSGPET